MVIVHAKLSKEIIEKIREEIRQAEDEDVKIDRLLQSTNPVERGEIVHDDVIFTRPSGRKRTGFYMNGYLKNNFDNYFIKAVENKWDGVILVTGMEGSGKSVATMSFAKYCDPTFPGRPINLKKNTRRYCDRVVFTVKDLMKAIDESMPGQAIVFDEAVMGFMASDASTEIQRTLIKKMVTIRKKRLYIFIVIPSIFLLRRYMAVFRTRALIHFYTPDGVQRGYFKFYSYDTKRKLYLRGYKEFNQNAVKPDFIGNTTNTEGFFFETKEYDDKKEAAIKEITQEKTKKGDKNVELKNRFKLDRDIMIFFLHYDNVRMSKQWKIASTLSLLNDKMGFDYGESLLRSSINAAMKHFGFNRKEYEAEIKNDQRQGIFINLDSVKKTKTYLNQ
jgi:hypothetical protein